MVDVEAAQKHYIEFAIFSAFVSFLCVFGNLTILYTFIRKKKIRYFGNYFLMSLSVTDLLTGYNAAGMCDPSFTCVCRVCRVSSAFKYFFKEYSPFFAERTVLKRENGLLPVNSSVYKVSLRGHLGVQKHYRAT